MWAAGVVDVVVVSTMAVLTSSAQSNDDFVMGVALSLGVVVGLGGHASMVVECE